MASLFSIEFLFYLLEIFYVFLQSPIMMALKGLFPVLVFKTIGYFWAFKVSALISQIFFWRNHMISCQTYIWALHCRSLYFCKCFKTKFFFQMSTFSEIKYSKSTSTLYSIRLRNWNLNNVFNKIQIKTKISTHTKLDIFFAPLMCRLPWKREVKIQFFCKFSLQKKWITFHVKSWIEKNQNWSIIFYCILTGLESLWTCIVKTNNTYIIFKHSQSISSHKIILSI